MKRVAKKEELPKWFSLKNYQVFRQMTDVELIEQVIARSELSLEIRAYININQTSDFLNMSVVQQFPVSSKEHLPDYRKMQPLDFCEEQI